MFFLTVIAVHGEYRMREEPNEEERGGVPKRRTTGALASGRAEGRRAKKEIGTEGGREGGGTEGGVADGWLG